MTSKSKRIRINRRTGKSYTWTVEITVPAGRGRKSDDGTNVRDDFILNYMKNIFTLIEKKIKKVGGECKIYR
jgi:hypothetical protein